MEEKQKNSKIEAASTTTSSPLLQKSEIDKIENLKKRKILIPLRSQMSQVKKSPRMNFSKLKLKKNHKEVILGHYYYIKILRLKIGRIN